MEGRLHHPPLPQVERVLARQEAFAEQPLGTFETPALVKEMGIRYEDISDPVGAAHEVHVDRPETEPAMSPCSRASPGQERERIAAEREKMTAGIAPRGPGRALVGAHGAQAYAIPRMV